MKKDCSKQSGFTLIEVLASIVILTIMFSVLSGFFVNSASYSNTFDKKLSAVQLSKSLLESYQKEGFEEGIKNIDKVPKELTGSAIGEKLGLTEEMIDTSAFTSTVEFSHPDLKTNPDLNPALVKRLLLIKVTVSDKRGTASSSSELEGYVRK
ncbi:prepilin-type N-terminal cleavage/methylation domain-containing protein [Metabacillus idriensis]|uniref:type IV pilus modification PilV family protein n=1 Tax=Metabacillus idriensis TaxID=324768 RepID=UPI00174E6DC6|nr:type II secretion system protein [Metabacillus idriensis]